MNKLFILVFVWGATASNLFAIETVTCYAIHDVFGEPTKFSALKVSKSETYIGASAVYQYSLEKGKSGWDLSKIKKTVRQDNLDCLVQEHLGIFTCEPKGGWRGQDLMAIRIFKRVEWHQNPTTGVVMPVTDFVLREILKDEPKNQEGYPDVAYYANCRNDLSGRIFYELKLGAFDRMGFIQEPKLSE